MRANGIKMKSIQKSSLQLVKLCVRALDSKKAGDLCVLDVSAQSSITDYMILATGTSEPHLQAMREELERVLRSAKASIIGMESTPGSGWTVFDAFEVMIHLFTAENRAKYRLELLWKDASQLPVASLLQPDGRKLPPAKRRTRQRKSLSKASRRK